MTHTATAAATAVDAASVLETCAALVAERYVFPEVGTRVAAALRATVGGGRYAGCRDAASLAGAVTSHLQDLSGDPHLRLLFQPDGAVGEDDPVAEDVHWSEQARRTAGGVRRVERLDGNVAVLDLGPVICAPQHGGDALCAAMSLVADADALVLDVRGCRGGSPDGVVLLLSHLFGPEPVRLSDIESRVDGTRQYWTQPVVPGRRFGADRPVAVLVGPETFSGGEALAFDLQEQHRAVVVGRRTRGGAHPRVGVVVHPQLELALPTARSVSLFTGDDWEGTGVEPDVPVAADEDPMPAALAALAGSRTPAGSAG